MDLTKTPITREQWLNEAGSLMLDEIFAPVCDLRPNLRIKYSVGYPPNTKAGSRIVGVCLSSNASSAGYNEIFISPVLNDSLNALEILAHEMIHAIDDNTHGHKCLFASIARKIGLQGKLTSTFAGPELRATLQEYVDMLGNIPHHNVVLDAMTRQVNRNIKCGCRCGFKFNTSRTQIQYAITQVGALFCPVCASLMTHDDL